MTWPVPTGEELEAAYEGWYRPAAGRFAGGGDRFLRRSRARLARRLDAIAPPGPVLDVGAGDGTLIRALERRGRTAVGIERASGQPGVRAADILEFDERAGQWAGVIFWHSLEHIALPARALDRASELLAAGGVLVVAVPNLDSWQARLFGPRWFHLDIPRHLAHLPARVLIDGMARRGLRVERLSYWRGGQVVFGWLFGLVAMLPGSPDLYSAIRRGEAQARAVPLPARMGILAAGVMLLPVALLAATAEIVARKGGTVYLEARRA